MYIKLSDYITTYKVGITNKYSSKVNDGEAPVLEHRRMGSASSLALLPGTLWSGLVVPIRVPSMGHIELFIHLTLCKQVTNV